jgi:YD repeat-containing protein
MKVTYDQQTDTLSVVFRDGAPNTESDEDKPGVILDYDALGNLVSLEILDASKRATETRKIEFETAAYSSALAPHVFRLRRSLT